MNEKNLIPNSQRTPSELREQTRKVGIASGKKNAGGNWNAANSRHGLFASKVAQLINA